MLLDADDRRAISEIVGKHFAAQPGSGDSRYQLPLTARAFGAEEVEEAIDSLLTNQLTMGDKVRRFEDEFAAYVGTKHAVMVNSGSSANLLALSALMEPRAAHRLRPGDEVITPAVTWATTVWPLAQLGLRTVLVDVLPGSFTVDPEQIEAAITPRTRAILLVHLLGRPCEMDEIMAIAARHDLAVIEDCCEAHGARYQGQSVGSFGIAGTFSFYYSHHITTIEGGMIVTDDHAVAEAVRAMRAFGWTRELADAPAHAAANPGIDPRFLFVRLGFNLRPTEIQGAFGLHQLKRLDGYVEGRRETAAWWRAAIANAELDYAVQSEAPDTRHAWFSYPLLVGGGIGLSRGEVQAHLERRGIETRPVMAGNIARQPAMAGVNHRVQGDLPVADAIHEHGLLIGIHHGVGEAERELVVATLGETAELGRRAA